MSALREPLLNTSDVLIEQHAPELRELARGIFESPQQHLALGNGKTEHAHFSVVGVLEPFRQLLEPRVASQRRELRHVAIRHGEAGKHHAVELSTNECSVQ